MAAQQLAVDAHTMLRPDQPFGPLLEGFVIAELARQATWSDQMVDLFHYRDQDKAEVDLILENRQRKVVAIEVKAASTVRSDDFSGLRKIADRLGDDLIAGIVLYTGAGTLAFGDRMRAVPVSALWEMG
ncbi:MAG TPA: DUF4143 domain-containing protein [Actinoplanes sp.]|nr:DUF4143 domain-containing protein [Actinoplanes sp.]